MFLSSLRRSFGLRHSVIQPLSTCTRLCSTETQPQIVERLEKSVNQVTLLGRAGQDAELRGTENYPVVQFSLATHVNFIKGGETVQNTIWHRISVFRPGLRESIHQNLKKGQRVMVQGRIGYLERKDPNDERIINKTVSIVAHEVVLFA